MTNGSDTKRPSSGTTLLAVLLAVTAGASALSGCLDFDGFGDDKPITAATAFAKLEDHRSSRNVRTSIAPVVGLAAVDIRGDDLDGRFAGLRELSKGPIGDGHAKRWAAIGHEPGSDDHQRAVIWERGLRISSPVSLPPFLLHAAGHLPLKEGGWLDSDAAAERAAALEPGWSLDLTARTHYTFMVLHHPETSTNPVWALARLPAGTDTPVTILIDAVTGNRLDPETIYVATGPETVEETVTLQITQSAMEIELPLADAAHGVAVVTIEPAEDPRPLTRVGGTLVGPEVDEEFPDGWPEPSSIRVERPTGGVHSLTLQGRTEAGSASMPVLSETVRVSWCLHFVLPDPLGVVALDGCDG